MAYQTIPIPIATNGLNKDLQPTQIPSASPNMINMIVERWGVRKRLGYTIGGTNLPLPGIGMELIQYLDAVGGIHQIALTSTCGFQYDSDSDQWLNICAPTVIEDCEDDWVSGAGSDTAAAQSTTKKVGSNALKIEVVADASDGDILCYEDLVTTDITSHNMITFWLRATAAISAGSIEIVLTEAELGAKTGTITTDYIEITNPLAMLANTWYNFNVALTDARVTTTLNVIESIAVYCNHDTELDGVDIFLDDVKVTTGFTGGASNRWSHTLATDTSYFSNNSGSALIIGNNVDTFRYFEGDAGDTLAVLDVSDFSGLTIAKEIIEFWNHFFVINYNSNVRNVAFTDLGDIVDWTNGTSGANALTDTRGKLLRARKLGSDMIIYSENSITTCRYLGGILLFAFPTLVYETGLFAEKALWDFVNVHYILGTDQKIYGYYGGQQFIHIGIAIENTLFSEINVTNKHNITFGIDSPKHKLYIFYPGSGDTYSSKAYAYNYKQSPQTWEYHEFAHTVRDMSIFTTLTGWYADGSELAGTYADTFTLYANASFTQSGHPVSIILTDDGYIFKLDEAGNKDFDMDIPCTYETMDITADGEEHYFRIAWVSFNLMSTVVNSTYILSYSIDSGKNWVIIEENASISDGALNTWQQHRHPIDVNNRRIRFRLTQISSTDLQIRAGHMKIEILEDR